MYKYRKSCILLSCYSVVFTKINTNLGVSVVCCAGIQLIMFEVFIKFTLE
jgi:hypothetical protein